MVLINLDFKFKVWVLQSYQDATALLQLNYTGRSTDAIVTDNQAYHLAN
jgi:hypothetical protein